GRTWNRTNETRGNVVARGCGCRLGRTYMSCRISLRETWHTPVSIYTGLHLTGLSQKTLRSLYRRARSASRKKDLPRAHEYWVCGDPWGIIFGLWPGCRFTL